VSSTDASYPLGPVFKSGAKAVVPTEVLRALPHFLGNPGPVLQIRLKSLAHMSLRINFSLISVQFDPI
jgi:hypothetical protein